MIPAIQLTVPNLADPRTHADPAMPELWRRLRSEDPVHWHAQTADQPGFWVISRYDDVTQVFRDHATFSSEGGNVLATMLHGGDTGAGRMLAVTDGLAHTDLRNLLLKAFAPRQLSGTVRQIRESVGRLLTEAVDRGECDFAKDIASVLPLETVCDLLAVPVPDRPRLLELTKSALASDYESPDAGIDRMARAEILLYFTDLVQARRKNPGTDPVSLMVTGKVTGRWLDDDDVILNCYSLLMGGDETSRLAMIGAVHALAHDPDQWQALKSERATIESAGEEILRWTTPTMHFGRSAVVSGQIGDRTIAAGDRVTLWLSSANRDEAVFADPDRLDLGRTPNRHLSLGYGRHFCVGAYLGRVEINTMLDGLRAFVGSIEQTGPGRRIYSNFLAGMSSLPVRLEPDRQAGRDWLS